MCSFSINRVSVGNNQADLGLAELFEGLLAASAGGLRQVLLLLQLSFQPPAGSQRLAPLPLLLLQDRLQLGHLA